MAKAKVSSSFNKFLSKNAKAVEEAKTAENSMMTCKMPIGWKGHCVCVGGEADKGKDRKDDKGNVQEGREYVNLDFNVVNDDEYAGSKFSLHWSFWDTEKATAMDRFEWMLNEMENLGLSREMRTEESTTIEDIINFFADSDEIFECEVVHNSYRRGDQKEVKVRRIESVTAGDSVVPTDTSPGIEVGGTVKYMGNDWEVTDADGEDLRIKSPKTGNIKSVKVSDLD